MSQGESKELDLQKAIEQGTQRTTLRDLEKKGVKDVKVLDEKALQELVAKAVDRVVNLRTQTTEEREKLLADSRKELDRLMKEHKAARGRSQLLESDKNELIAQVESLQRELSLQAELEEENLQKKFAEGTASMEKQVAELREAMGRELAEERSKVREADQGRRDAVAQILKLQNEAKAAGQEIKSLKEELVRQRAEMTRLKEDGTQNEAERKKRETAEHAAWMLENQLADAKKSLEAVDADLKSARKAAGEAQRLKEELDALQRARHEAIGELAVLKAQASEEHARAEALSKASKSLRDELEAARREVAVDNAVLKERSQEVEHLKAKVLEEHERGERLAQSERTLREEIDTLKRTAAVDASVLKERALEVEHLKAKVLEEHGRAEELAKAGRALREEYEELRRSAAVEGSVLKERALEVEHLKAKVLEEHDRAEALLQVVESLRANLEEARRAGAVDAAVLNERTIEVQHLKAKVLEEHERAEGHKERELALRVELDRAVKAIAEASAAEAESALKRQEAEQRARAEMTAEVESLRRELAEAETRREGGIVLAAEIEKIEDARNEERLELERLRAEALALRDHETRLRQELTSVRGDLRELYAIVAREQGLAKSAQDESVQLHRKALDLQGQAGTLSASLADLRARAKPDAGPELERLREALAKEKKDGDARLKALAANLGPEIERLREALEKQKKDAAALAAKKAQPDPAVARLEEAVRRSRERLEAEKKAAAARLKALAAKTPDRRLGRKLAELRDALKKARVKKASGASGVGLDGRGLLEDFLRRLQLKELFQRHVPVAGTNGRSHPSETLLELVEASAAGPTAPKEPSGSRLEVFGAPGKPTLDELKTFQARLAPRAVRQIERVHDGLRRQLVPPPAKGERLVLDVDLPLVEIGKKGRLGAYRPLVCFDGARGEFWKARLRPAKADAAEGALPFLRECLAKVPRGVARGRVLLRLDGRLFSEPVLRFLDRAGVGFVLPAPDGKELRAAARKAPLRELSGGWSVGEFDLRVHPIRGTKARCVVLRRRASKPGPAPTFSEHGHAYHVLCVDRGASPWRAWTSIEGREAALGVLRGSLRGWAESPLLGKGRRARAASFTTRLLASDVLQWFKRAGLPPARRELSQESLRRDVLLLSPPDTKRRESTVLVLPKRDGRRRLYRDVAERLSRLKTTAPFKLGQ